MSSLIELFFEKPGVVLNHLTCLTTATFLFLKLSRFSGYCIFFHFFNGPVRGFLLRNS